MLRIDEDLGTLQTQIISVNTISSILAIILIILSFGFIIPSYNNLKFKSERILMIVSRLKEEETNQIIYHLRQIGAKLFSDDDEYLHIDFSNITLREENENQSQSNRKSKKKSRSRQNYLYDRILDNKLRFWIFIVILITLCLLSILFFMIVNFFTFLLFKLKIINFFGLEFLYQHIMCLVLIFIDTNSKLFKYNKNNKQIFVYSFQIIFKNISLAITIQIFKGIFIYLSQFKTTFGDPADKYKKFIEGSMQFSTSTSTHNSIILQNLFKDDKLQEVMSLRDETLQLAQLYFSSDFIKIQQQSDSQQFKNVITDISETNICNLGILQEAYNTFCKSALEGILTQGLQPTVSTIIQTIENQMNVKSNFKEFIQSKEYQEGLIVQQLLTNLMTYIVDKFEKENLKINEDYLFSLVLILTLGSLIYGLIFFIVMGVYLRKLKREYIVIKRAIQLVPYSRLTEDSMTLFLLKKVMDV